MSATMYIEVGILYPSQGIPLPIGGAGLIMQLVAVLLAQNHYSDSDYQSSFVSGDSIQDTVSHSG